MNKVFYKTRGLKKFSSILLLLVFIVGITPKKTLHNWFANHKDSTSSTPAGKTPQITKAGFICSCDDFVAESHFITVGSFVVVNIPSLLSFISLHNPSFISLSHLVFNLRGPPLKILVA